MNRLPNRTSTASTGPCNITSANFPGISMMLSTSCETGLIYSSLNGQYLSVLIASISTHTTTHKVSCVRELSMKDTSLDEFLSAAETDERDEDSEPEEPTEGGDSVAMEQEEETDEVNETVEADIEPAVGTSRWSPEGAVCDSCDENANRVWEDDGRYVCRACVEW